MYWTHHVSVLKETGIPWAFGENIYGQLGTNDAVNHSSPVLVVGDHSFVEIDGNGRYNLAVKANGEIWGWGDNYAGQLGDSSRISTSSPVKVVGNHSFVRLAASQSNSIGLKANGEMWTWGLNWYGGLGDNTKTSRSSPVLAVGDHSFISVVVGSSTSYGLKADGEMWACGGNTNYGQLGIGEWSTRSSLVKVVGNHNFISLDAGTNTCFGLKASGEAWGWGNDTMGQLGHNTAFTSYCSPVNVVGGHVFNEVSCGHNHTMATKANGEMWCWGEGGSGELGEDWGGHRSSPVKVVGNHPLVKLRGGEACSFALKLNGEMWNWGNNDLGQLGDNTTASRKSPVRVVGNHNHYGLRLLTFEGTVCWGHVTGVEESWARHLQGNWTGDGTISGSSDAEKMELDFGQEMVSEARHTNRGTFVLKQNYYQSGIGAILYYRTAVAKFLLDEESWSLYDESITSLGWVQLKLEGR